MKRLLMLIPLVFLCCLGCQQGGDATGEPATDMDAFIQAVKESYASWEAGVNAANIDRSLSSLADDVVLIPPNEPAYVGKDAFRSYYQQIFDEFTVQGKYVVEDVQVGDNLTVAYVTYSGIYTPKAGGEPFKTNGNVIDVCKKQSDGAWKTIYSIWSDERLIYPDQAK